MRIYRAIYLVGVAGLVALTTGCVHHRPARVVRPPAPQPPPIVVHPPHQPRPVVVVKPTPEPPPKVVVVAPPAHPPAKVIVHSPAPAHVPPGQAKKDPHEGHAHVHTPPGHARKDPHADHAHSHVPPGHAKKYPHVSKDNGHARKAPAASAAVAVTFSPQEREILYGYVKHSHSTPAERPGKKGKGLPPGLAKKAAHGGDLPPGWQKRCVRGETMPAEVYRRCEPLPEEVVVKLPAPPPDTIVVTIEGKVVRLARATLEILDVLEVL